MFESNQSKIITILKRKILSRYAHQGIPARRDQHTKQHACLRADFIIAEDLPTEYRVGLFKESKTFPAWVRFSNAREEKDDTKQDVRGMAVKVMEVEGEKVLQDEPDANTQDFLLVNHPVFFLNQLSDYPDVLDYSRCPMVNKVPLLKFFLIFGRRRDRQQEWQVLKTMFRKPPISSPLATEYFSMTPYAFGNAGISAVKYLLQPAASNAPTQSIPQTENYLRNSIEQFFQDGKEAYFDFCIQIQGDPEEMPLENPTVEWKTERRKLATLKISPQPFTTPQRMEFGENLSFTPWHSLVEHQPLGEMNRLRKAVYQQTAAYRRQELNHLSPQEPTAVTPEPQLPNYEEPYRWVSPAARYPGATPYVDGFPAGEDFSGSKLLAFLGTALMALVGLLNAQFLHTLAVVCQTIRQGTLRLRKIADFGLSPLLSQIGTWHNLDEFQSFFKPWTFLAKPSVSERWMEDIEFGRQRIAGLNPVVIRAYRPEEFAEAEFPITEDLLKSVLEPSGENFSLKEALEQHRLYVLDYRIFDGILTPVQEDQIGRYTASSLTLFYVDAAEQLIPCAIQLKPNSYRGASDCPTRMFTPLSPPDRWILAKTVVTASDTAYHGIVSHLIETHLISEMFAVSTFRTLPKDHILSQMLKPHFFNTIAINFMARSTALGFLGRGRLFDTSGALGYSGSNELMSRAYYGKGLVTDYQGDPWSFYQRAFPQRLTERGIKHLPNYFYREDAQKVWDTIHSYVKKVLQVHYGDGDRLQADHDLQRWLQDLTSPEGAHLQGLTGAETNSMDTVAALIGIVTTVIFTATAQHAAVNFGHYDYAGWVPNMPFALYKPLDQLFEDNPAPLDLVQWLPNRTQSLKQITLMKTLSLLPPYTSASLLTLRNPYPSNSDSHQEFEVFQNQLKDLDTQINERNQALIAAGKVPYEYLRPSRIPQSVAI
jgi:hypothetical protein